MRQTPHLHHFYENKSPTSALLESHPTPSIHNQPQQTNSIRLDQINEETKQYLTFNDMHDELQWLINKWRKQAIIKATIMTMIIICLIVFGVFNLRLCLCLLFYSVNRFFNQGYMRVYGVRIWLQTSQILAIILLENQMILLLLPWIDSSSCLNANSQFSHYSFFIAINCAILFIFLTKISHRLFMPYIYQTILQNIKSLTQSLPSMLINISYHIFLIIKLEVLVLLSLYIVVVYCLQITNIIILHDLFCLKSLIVSMLTITTTMIMEHIITISISNEVCRYLLHTQKYGQKKQQSRVPYILELLRLDHKMHVKLDGKLIFFTYLRCLEWLVCEKIEASHHPAAITHSQDSPIREFMNTKIYSSRFYHRYLDLFKEFAHRYLINFKRNNLQKLFQINEELFVSEKLNRASLMIDLSYHFRVQFMELKKYFIILNIQEDFEIISKILEIMASLIEISTSNSSQDSLDRNMVEVVKQLEIIYQSLETAESSQNVRMKNKIKRVLSLYCQGSSFMTNKKIN